MITINQQSIKTIYFIAICGTAMASLAAMLKSQGYQVTGSDESIYPPMSNFLSDRGIEVLQGFDAAHLDPTPDLVIIGNAMSRGNPEVEEVLNRKIPYASLPQILKDYFIRGKTSIVVAGTHGKTTTASLMAWILEKSGRDPGFLIGGIPENFEQGFKVGDDHYFVVEGDEYDTAFFDKGPKFLHYLPEVVILNNVEFDHADIYNNIDEIKLNFKRLINIIPGNGLLVANSDDINVCEVIQRAFCKVETFGLGKEAIWQAHQISISPEETSFELRHNGRFISAMRIPLCGEHNVRNSLAVIAVCRWLGIEWDEITSGLLSFKGVKKRLQLLAEINQIKIFDDFAHHPTEIKETLKGLRAQYPNNRIWAIFEPRTSTAKRKIFLADYVAAFSIPTFSIIGPIHRPDKINQNELLPINTLISKLKEKSGGIYHFQKVDQIVFHLKQHTMPGDILVIMSNGSFGNIHHKLIETLK